MNNPCETLSKHSLYGALSCVIALIAVEYLYLIRMPGGLAAFDGSIGSVYWHLYDQMHEKVGVSLCLCGAASALLGLLQRHGSRWLPIMGLILKVVLFLPFVFWGWCVELLVPFLRHL